ncbi:hypothetical protein D3C86_2135050 [compost metagenome]
MAERIIDILEAIEVHMQDRQTIVAVFDLVDCSDMLIEIAAIGQSGQGVMQGVVLHVPAGRFQRFILLFGLALRLA